MRSSTLNYSTSTLSKLLTLLVLLFTFSCARKNFYAATPVTDATLYQQLQQATENIDSVTVQAGSHYQRGFIYRLFWGGRHRAAWASPVRVRVLDMNSEKGGLKVEKIGGGMQTISASLVGGDSMTYVLRSVDKQPQVNLPFPLNYTFLSDLIRDQTSALHPYAALVVAPLAEAAQITHPHPELVYVRPRDPALSEHQNLLGDRLYMLEEKYNDKRALTGQLENARNIIGTEKMLNRRNDKHNHYIDQVTFAKARLLDLLVGDRDRHEAQWEWAVYSNGATYTYRPIPKDRDNAFFRFDDGLFSWILSRKWAQRKFVTFNGDYRDVKALMIKSAYIDKRALPQLTSHQFDSLAQVLQKSITDQVIEEAVRKLPASVYAIDGEQLTRQLKNRRNTLHLAARKFYEALAKDVLVVGTKQEDLFEINYRSAEEAEIIVRDKLSGRVSYRRTFNRTQTQKVKIHGLAGDDTFIVKGNVHNSIKFSVSGGDGQDTLSMKGALKNKSRIKTEKVETITR